MYISKQKDYRIIPISEIKQDLRIDQNDNSYNQELQRLAQASIAAIEKRIQSDIVPTINSLEDYSFAGYQYQINEPNIILSAITYTQNLETNPITYTASNGQYTMKKFNQYTLIKFKQTFQADQINIVYTSGYNSIPDDLKRAVIMLVAQYFDVDKSGYVNNGMIESKAIDRLISPYCNYIYN